MTKATGSTGYCGGPPRNVCVRRFRGLPGNNTRFPFKWTFPWLCIDPSGFHRRLCSRDRS